MPSKPPISKPKKAANRTAKKLPGRIAKRFKQKAQKNMLEDERWAKIEAEKNGVVVEDVKIEAKAPVVQPPQPKAAPGRKKGMNNRRVRMAAREKLVLN